MKRIIFVILVMLCVFSLSFSAIAASQEIIILSDLSDEEIVAFIKSHGVDIPEIYEEEILCAPFVRSLLKCVEQDTNADFSFINNKALGEFANEIKAVADAYYGTTDIMLCDESYTNILQDNVRHGSWSDAYLDYRCYSYVLGRTDYVEPGQIEWLGEHDNLDEFEYNYSAATVLNIARRAEDDLVSLGYTVNVFSTTMPSTQLTSHTHLICVRKGTGTFTDYHFMKLGLDGNWYHKPGKSNPLRYLHVPSNSEEWVVEAYFGNEGIYVRYPQYAYDSVIYFIEYTTPHEYEYEYCGSDQHIRTCTICGGTSGSASSCIYVNNYCKSCGHYNGYTQITPNKRPGTETAATE